MVELIAQPLRLVAAEQARGPGAEQAAAAAGADRCHDGRGQRPARGDHRPGRDRRADVGEPADDPDPADRERVVADEGRARHARIVRQLLHLLIGVTELLLDRLRAGQKAELRAVEARVQQVLDRILQAVAVMEDPDRLADHVGRWGRSGSPGSLWPRPSPTSTLVGRQDTRTRRARGGCPRAAPIMRQKPTVGQREDADRCPSSRPARAGSALEVSRAGPDAAARRGRRPGAEAARERRRLMTSGAGHRSGSRTRRCRARPHTTCRR